MLNYVENSAKIKFIATRKIQIDEEIGWDYTPKVVEYSTSSDEMEATEYSSNVSKISDADERKKILKGLGFKETSYSLWFRI